MNLVFWIAFFAVVAAIIFGMYSQKKEGFASSIADYNSVNRSRYLKLGKNRYNELADQVDIFRPGVTTNMKELDIINYNRLTNEAIKSSELEPTTSLDGLTNTTSKVVNGTSALPLENAVLKAAKKCEANTSRDACSILGNPEYQNCGVCILGGTDTQELKKGSFIGGMLILDRDKRSYEIGARGTGKEPAYEPTTGDCPAGYFFVNKEKCTKAVNRQNCKEAGLAGGFNGGRTIEGKEVVNESCALCPNSGEENTYIYEPKIRAFPLALRVITPTGTGTNTVRITNREGVQIASGQGQGGDEIYINLSGVVVETQAVNIIVTQQFPHIPRGRKEVFQVGNGYIYSYDEAQNVCKSIGGDLATYQQLIQSFNAGGQECSYGFYKDYTSTTAYFMQVEKLRKDIDLRSTADSSGWCGWGVGMRNDGVGNKAAAWCYGVKPPVGLYGSREQVRPFFRSMGNLSVPSQENQPDQKSQYGNQYQAPYYRGVILQWEMRTEQSPVPRRASVEASITSVMGMAPNTVTIEGFKTFRILKRRGMFSTPLRNPNAMIISPTPNTNKNIMANQYWIWSNQTDNPTFYFTADIPGTFKDPFYVEDMPICPRGPLVGNKNTLDLLQVSPCQKLGQAPGKYSIDCLKFLFVSAGGDLYNGTLSPINGDINKLLFDENKRALEEDAILERLTELYNTATKGRDIMGDIVSPNNKKMRRKIINDAAMALFGKEIVTPCEEVTESPEGSILLVQKSAPFDSECLNYLYLNTGIDQNRGMEPARDTSLKATYVSIGDRFSGIMNSEKATEQDKERYPFQTCQLGGSAAPVNGNGTENMTAIQMANSYALANGGTVRGAQDYFNQIFKDANMSINDVNGAPDSTLLKRQEDAINKCYGITKTIDPDNPTGCGLMAKFVVVFRSLSGWGANAFRTRDISSESWGSRVALSQVQVFDPMGNEIGKNRYTLQSDGSSGKEFANDGNTNVRTNNIFREFDTSNERYSAFEINLGQNKEVQKVTVYNNASSPGIMTNAIVALFNAEPRMIAHKVLPEFTTSATVVFSKEDLRSPILPSALKPNITFLLQSAITNQGSVIAPGNKYDTTYSYYGDSSYIPVDTFNIKQLAGMQIMPPLCGINGTISIAMIARPDHYLSHWTSQRDGMRIGFLRNGSGMLSSTKNKKEASWIVRPALTGETGWFALQNVANTKLYLSPWSQLTNYGYSLALNVDPNNWVHKVLTSWRALPIPAV